MIRPNGKSVVGPDGGIWTGWYANYGSFGGGISRIDPHTQQVKAWVNLIDGQAIEHIAAGTNDVFAVTSGSASGMADRDDRFYLLKFSCDGAALASHCFEKGKLPRKLAVWNGRICVLLWDRAAGEGCAEWFGETGLEPQGGFSFGKIGREEHGCAPTDLLPLSSRLLLVFTFENILICSVPEGRALCDCPSPGFVQTCTRTADGAVWFASKKKLYQLCLDE